MSNSLLNAAAMAIRTALLLSVVAPALVLAAPQSHDDAAVQSAAKLGAYSDVDANPSRMAAIRQDKASAGEAAARMTALQASASPPVRDWVRVEAQRLALGDPSVPGIAAAARERFGNDLADGDIDQLVQLVMAEVSQQADQELRDQLAQMQAHNHQKQTQRDAVSGARRNGAALQARMSAEFQATQPGNRAELAEYVARASDGKDSLDNMGEMDQMRLQRLMDRRQKALETLSNLMAKASDTSASIIGNLK